MSILAAGGPAGVIVEPVTAAEREPAPPLPQGTLNAEPVPPANRPTPVPLLRILMPVVMIAGMAAMVGLMMLGGAGANPMMLIIQHMVFWYFHLHDRNPERTRRYLRAYQ